MKATVNQDLINLYKCRIYIPGYGAIIPYVLPDISDQKGAVYNDEPIQARATPLKTYAYSENRSISLTLHFIAKSKNDIYRNLYDSRALQSALYPRDEFAGANAPFVPPAVCKIRCGRILADYDLCVVLKNYSVKYPTDVPWDEETYLPWKFDVDTSWDVVYKSSDLPGANRILNFGR